VIRVAVRRYLRSGLSHRDVEDLIVERGIEVDHVTVSRWVQRFTPLLADAARFARHASGDRWFVDETYVKVNGGWRRGPPVLHPSATEPHGGPDQRPVASSSTGRCRPRSPT
jgi:hypothetical protein